MQEAVGVSAVTKDKAVQVSTTCVLFDLFYSLTHLLETAIVCFHVLHHKLFDTSTLARGREAERQGRVQQH